MGLRSPLGLSVLKADNLRTPPPSSRAVPVGTPFLETPGLRDSPSHQLSAQQNATLIMWVAPDL